MSIHGTISGLQQQTVQQQAKLRELDAQVQSARHQLDMTKNQTLKKKVCDTSNIIIKCTLGKHSSPLTAIAHLFSDIRPSLLRVNVVLCDCIALCLSLLPASSTNLTFYCSDKSLINSCSRP